MARLAETGYAWFRCRCGGRPTQSFFLVAIDPDALALPSEHGGAGVLAHRQHAASATLAFFSKSMATKRSLDDASESSRSVQRGQMDRAQQMGGVVECADSQSAKGHQGRFGERLAFDGDGSNALDSKFAWCLADPDVTSMTANCAMSLCIQ